MAKKRRINFIWLQRAASIGLLIGLLLVLVACNLFDNQATLPGEKPSAAAPQQVAPTVTRAPAVPTDPLSLKLLKLEPEKGKIGSAFTVSGEGLPPNQEVVFSWATVDGSYSTKVMAENIEFYEKVFVDKRLTLGRATTDAQGRVTASLKVPEDYGEVHDLFAVVGGKDVARGGYRILRDMNISPEKGPVGTPITLKITGLGWGPFESVVAIRYDNNFTGIVTAVTTRGSATVQIRAAGPVGGT